MVLFKYLSLSYYNNCLIYIEGNQLVNFGIFSTRKIRVYLSFLIFQNDSSIYVFSSVFNNFYFFIKNWKYLYAILRSFFFGSLFGYLHGFRLVGRGYKAYLQLNNFIFRLGYSHNVYYSLPLHYKTAIKDKMRNFWLIKGVNLTSLSTVINHIRSFRIPNVYMHKGIYKIGDSYRIKATKKGNVL
jgi:large subunit ribosomal protein L6